jgi:hypothetical protein
MINFTPSVAADGAQPNRSSVRVAPGLTEGSNTAADEHAVVGTGAANSESLGRPSVCTAPALPKKESNA